VVKTVLEKFKEKDAETSFLFEDAIEKLDKIDVQANESKKQIVRELAKNLKGNFQSDTICIEITNRLSG
jgi:tetrahydromethanopterin S-methyltransferase subunit A